MGCEDGIRDAKDTNSNANIKHDLTLKSDIKFIWLYGSNALINQHGDINKTIEILSDETKCEMIVCIDNHMTVSARYSDILLPDVTTAEQVDLAAQGSSGNLGYAIFTDKAIEPLYECKSVYEQMAGVAEKLGVKQKFTEGRTQEDWVRWILDESRKEIPDLPSFEEFRRMGIFKKKLDSVIGMKTFRDDPKANPLTTPSGKIEIFSSNLHTISKTWKMEEGNTVTALPEYVRSREMPGDRCRRSTRSSASATTTSSGPTPATATSPGSRRPTRSRCGSTSWTPGLAASSTATRSRSSTTAGW